MTPSEKRTILIVDDEPSIRMFSRAALTAAGYQASEAADAGAATRAVRSATRPFDLVLLDLSLPDAGGADLIPEVRASSPDTRVLLVSGSHEDDAAGLDHDGFLNKPFTRTALLDAVRKLLGPG